MITVKPDPSGRSELDLSYARFERALTLEFKELPGLISFRKAQLPDLAIIGPKAPEGQGSESVCDVSLRAADIRGTVVLKWLRLLRPIDLQAIRIRDDFRALDCKAGGSRKAFAYEVYRDLSSDAREPAMLLDRADVGGRLSLQDCHFCGPVSLFNARVRGGLELQASTFHHPKGTAILADGLRVGGDFLLRGKVEVHGRVCMVNAKIGGELDLRGGSFQIMTNDVAADSPHPLSGGEALTCYRLQVGGSVRLGRRSSGSTETDATLAHHAAAGAEGETRDRAGVIGCLNFHGATVAGHFRVEGLRMERKGDGRDAADQAAIVLNAAVIGRNLEFIDVSSTRQITLVAAEIKGDLIFSRVRLTCDRVAVFGIRAHIHGHVRLGADRGDKVMDEFLHQRVPLTEQMGSEITGIVDFSGMTVGGFVDATALTIHGRAVRDFDPPEQLNSGKNVLALVMDEAAIGRRLCLGHDESGGASAVLLLRDVVETHFYGTVSLVGLRVRGDVYLNGAEFRSGTRLLSPRPEDAEEPGWKRSTELRRAVSYCVRLLSGWANDAKTPAAVPLAAEQRKVSFGPVAVDLTRARIEGCLNWTLPELAGWPESREELGQSGECLKPIGEVHFSQAHVGILLDDIGCWPDWGRLRIDGFVFNELHPATESITTWNRLKWLRLQEKGSQHFSLKAYDHLIGVYRGMGTEEPVAMVALAKQKAILDRWPARSNFGAAETPTVWDKGRAVWARTPFGLRNVLLWTCGCGYRPVNTVILLGLLIFISTMVFKWNANSFYPVGGWQYPSSLVRDYPRDGNGERGEGCRNFEALPAHMKQNVGEYAWGPVNCVYPEFNSFYHAIDLAVPVIDLGRARYWEALPGHGLLDLYIVLHVFVGHLLVILLALSPIGILRSATKG